MSSDVQGNKNKIIIVNAEIFSVFTIINPEGYFLSLLSSSGVIEAFRSMTLQREYVMIKDKASLNPQGSKKPYIRSGSYS